MIAASLCAGSRHGAACTSNQGISSITSFYLLPPPFCCGCLFCGDVFLLIQSVVSSFHGKKSSSITGSGSQEPVAVLWFRAERFCNASSMGTVPAVGTRSLCETTGFCESSASELMLHLLKQKFTFKEMEGIHFFQMYHQGKEKRKQTVQIIIRKKKVFPVNDSFFQNLPVLCNCIVSS